MRESDVLSSVLLAVGGRTDARAWRMQSGVFVPVSARATCPTCRASGAVSRFDPHPVTRIGVNGMADVLVLMHGGRCAWIECKSDSGRQSEDQRNFQATVERFGSRYVLARSAEDAMMGLAP